MDEGKNYFEDDEIDLYELWMVIWRRKKLIISIVVLVTAIGVLYALLRGPGYEVKAILVPNSVVIGLNINGYNTSHEDGNFSPITFTYNFNIRNFVSVVKDDYYIQKVFVENGTKIDAKIPRGANIVEVSYKTHKPEEAKAKIAKLLELAASDPVLISPVKSPLELRLAEYKSSLMQVNNSIDVTNNQIVILKAYLKEVEKTIEKCKAELSSLSREIKTRGDNDIGRLLYVNLYQITTTRLISLKKMRSELEEKIAEFQEKLSSLKIDKALLESNIKKVNEKLFNLKAFSVKGPYVVETKSKKTLIIAVSFVASLFLGILLAFFLEWLENARKRYKEANP